MTIPCIYWPVTVASSSMVFRLTRTPSATGVGVTANTTATAGTYYAHEGTGSLATQLETDFGTVDGVSIALTVSATGVVTIVVSGLQAATNATIGWTNSAATQALGTALGFDVSAADTVAVSGGTATFTGDYPMPRYWTPDLPPRSDEPVIEQEVVVSRTMGGQNAFDRLSQLRGRRVAFEFVAAAKTKQASETGGSVSIERLLTDSAAPARFRYWNDRTTVGSGSDDYFLDASVLERIEPQRLSEAVALYSFTLPMWEHVS